MQHRGTENEGLAMFKGMDRVQGHGRWEGLECRKRTGEQAVGVMRKDPYQSQGA